MLKTIDIELTTHKSKGVYALAFDYDETLVAACRKLKAKWSASKRYWYLEVDERAKTSITNAFEGLAKLRFKPTTKQELLVKKTIPIKNLLTIAQKNVLNNFYKYLKGKRFSESTVNTYVHLVAEFVVYQKEKNISLKGIEKYIEDVLVAKNSSISTHRQFVSSIKHFLIFREADFEIDFKKYAPKKDKKLPNVLSNEEVIDLIRVTKNLKHRICITLIYSSGLRIGELLALKISDFDVNRKLLKVVNSKGRKDRYVPIANTMMPMLHNYLTTYNPKTFLIESLTAGKPYTAGSIRNFLQRSCKLAKITKKVTPHTLRHSYATHLLENGTDIRYIQELLGHAKPETTMIYTHVQSQDLQKITNPLDLIVKQLENREKIN